MIKILHVVSSLSAGSGVMNFIMNYYRKINKSEIQFDFLYWEESQLNFKEEIESFGGKTFKITKPKISFKFKKEISKFFKQHSLEYKAVHCHPIFSFAFVSSSAKSNGIKHIIQHSHTSEFSRKLMGKIRNSLILKLSPIFVTEYIACSDEALKLFSKKELKNKKNIILNNAIDFEKYYFDKKSREKIREKYQILPNTVVIGHVGRFSEEKNHKQLIEIFKKYNSSNPNSKLLLIGDGPLKKEIESQIENLNLNSQTIFTGNISNTSEYLAAMDYFVFPSFFEGFGLAALEAEINGLFVICSSAIPKSALISKFVYQCKSDDTNEYLDILNQQLKNSDETRKIKLINNDFDINKQAKKLENFYSLLK